MPPSYKSTDLVEAHIDLLQAHPELGIQRVYYGDQETIPEAPAVCVEPGAITRELGGVPFQTKNEFGILLIIYSAGLEGVEDVQRKVDLLAENISDLLHTEAKQLGGLVAVGYTTSIEYGYSIKSNRLVRANRITWSAHNKTHLVQDALGNPL